MHVHEKAIAMPYSHFSLSRRQFVTGAVTGGLTCGLGIPVGRASEPASLQPDFLRGNQFDLTIGYQQVNYTGVPGMATTVNGSLPSPTLVWKEGERVSLRVKNTLAEDSSIHWHGIILPTGMDGVPGMSFAGIKPGETFEYSFDVKQSGTYWYHSHSGFQEMTGMYGALIIEPREEKHRADQDYVVELSDWTDEDPHTVFRKLKVQSDLSYTTLNGNEDNITFRLGFDLHF